MIFLARFSTFTIGLIMLISSGLLIVQRQQPSNAYFVVDTEHNPSTGFVSTYRMLPNGQSQRRLLSERNRYLWWSDDGLWVYYQHYAQLYRTNLNGTRNQLIATLIDETQPSPTFSRFIFSSDQQWIAFESPTGEQNTLYRVRADGTHLQPIVHIDGEIIDYITWSPDDQWIYFQTLHADANKSKLYRVHPDGKTLQILGGTSRPYTGAWRWSPDGKWVSFLVANRFQRGSLGAIPSAGGEIYQLTNELIYGESFWSPDSEWIIFEHPSPATFFAERISNLSRIRPDGTEEQRLIEASEGKILSGLSRDGNWIIYHHYEPPPQAQLVGNQPNRNQPVEVLFRMRLDGSEKQPVVNPHLLETVTATGTVAPEYELQAHQDQQNATLYFMRPDGSAAQALISFPYLSSAYLSGVVTPDRAWIIVSYDDVRGQRFTFRLRPDGSDRQALPAAYSNDQIRFSPIIDLAWRSWQPILGGIGLIFAAFLPVPRRQIQARGEF